MKDDDQPEDPSGSEVATEEKFNFSPPELQVIYGQQWFNLPEDPFMEEMRVLKVEVRAYLKSDLTEPEVPDHEQEATNLPLGPVDWKLRPGSSITLILEPEEFSDAARTRELKEWLVAAQINPKDCSFGILPEGAFPDAQLQDLPDRRGLVFSTRINETHIAPEYRERVQTVPTIETGLTDPTAKKAIEAALLHLSQPLI